MIKKCLVYVLSKVWPSPILFLLNRRIQPKIATTEDAVAFGHSLPAS